MKSSSSNRGSIEPPSSALCHLLPGAERGIGLCPSSSGSMKLCCRRELQHTLATRNLQNNAQTLNSCGKSRDFPCSHLNSLWLLHLQQKRRAVCVRAGRRWGCLSRAVVRVWSTMAQQLILPRDTAWARAQGSITLIKSDALIQCWLPSRADPQGRIQLPVGTSSPGHR